MPLGVLRGSRSQLLAGACLFIMAVFVVRLFYLQIIKHDFYVNQADQEQLKQLVIPAKRGEIYAMDGATPVKIVLNETVYTVFVDPEVMDEPKKVVETIRQVAGGTARDNLESLVKKGKTEAGDAIRYRIVATQVTRKQAELMKNKHLKGLGFQETTRRVYPEGQLAAQTLGFVDAEGKGQYGVEGKLNDRLVGKDGLLQSVTDVANVPLTIGDKHIYQPPKHGDNVVLSIDRNVQSFVESTLAKQVSSIGAKYGSVVVMNPNTGRIMAMANVPTYKPAEFTKVQDAAAFNNAVVSTPYEPGSVIKTFTVATGIDKGVVTPKSTYVNTDSIRVEDRTIHNALLGHTGTISIQDALNFSLNTGMVTIAQRLGDGSQITSGARNTIYSYFHDKFGLGAPTKVEVSGEASGIVISPEEGEGNAVRYSNMVFGQGLDITMLQVAAGYSAMVNGGNYYQPTVIGGVADDEGKVTEEAPRILRQGIIKKSTSDTMRSVMHTARKTFLEVGGDRAGYYVGGKTGTSETLVNGKYIKNQTIGTYLGFGGTHERSEYVIMVQVSGPGLNLEGNVHAKPIFTDISNWLIDYMKLQPKG